MANVRHTADASAQPAPRPEEPALDAPADVQAALRLHGNWLRAVAIARLHGTDGLDDVMQDVAMSAVRNWKTLRSVHNARAWLYRLTVRAALMHRRTLGRARRRINEAGARATMPLDQSPVATPLESLLNRERVGQLQAVMRKLPAKDAEMLMLKHVDNCSYQEIAQRMGVTLNVVQMRLFRIRKKLRGELEASGRNPSAENDRG
jgi:RNA polymerase sigma factor (sigma-70 family)